MFDCKGTGKTSTIVTTLQVLAGCGKRTLASAPTNVAVCEIARRCLKTLESPSDDKKCIMRLANLVLFGMKKRLDITDEDPLISIHFEERIVRLKLAFAEIPLLSAKLSNLLLDAPVRIEGVSVPLAGSLYERTSGPAESIEEYVARFKRLIRELFCQVLRVDNSNCIVPW